ncbi:hypothetical protein CUN38_04965 [Enterococcus faecium]|uniref:hypothetical protein n=1 Tax=Enterococcus faecium TaxID=1352 RepID=UPI000CF15DDC|nr:hypothetical protein [Enterococcus faecium]PQC93495.1 hypothetical protein CUN38_04965 [Enterococcus faecium]
MKVKYINEYGYEAVTEDKDGLKIIAVKDNAIVIQFAEPSVKKRAKVENGQIVYVENYSSGIIEIPVQKILEKSSKTLDSKSRCC